MGVVVVEAKEKSGALISAKHALDQNRDIFALPGPITSPLSVGPNVLIKEGATPVLSPADIINSYPGLLTAKGAQQSLTESGQTDDNLDQSEQRVLDALALGAVHVDAIATATDLALKDLLPLLTQMEFKVLIKSVGSGTYIKT